MINELRNEIENLKKMLADQQKILADQQQLINDQQQEIADLKKKLQPEKPEKAPEKPEIIAAVENYISDNDIDIDIDTAEYIGGADRYTGPKEYFAISSELAIEIDRDLFDIKLYWRDDLKDISDILLKNRAPDLLNWGPVVKNPKIGSRA